VLIVTFSKIQTYFFLSSLIPIEQGHLSVWLKQVSTEKQYHSSFRCISSLVTQVLLLSALQLSLKNSPGQIGLSCSTILNFILTWLLMEMRNIYTA